MSGLEVRGVGFRGRSFIYVMAVTLIATVGVIERSPWLVVLAGLLTLPASIVALPCYYMAYGVLALVFPGANPSSNSGSVTIAPDGHTLRSVTTGMPADWFMTTTLVLGILSLAVAALVNVLLLRALAARRRAPS